MRYNKYISANRSLRSKDLIFYENELNWSELKVYHHDVLDLHLKYMECCALKWTMELFEFMIDRKDISSQCLCDHQT